jgi:hypothetical protein
MPIHPRVFAVGDNAVDFTHLHQPLLSRGLDQEGAQQRVALVRALAALKVCSAKLAARRVTRFRLIATEACRTGQRRRRRDSGQVDRGQRGRRFGLG